MQVLCAGICWRLANLYSPICWPSVCNQLISEQLDLTLLSTSVLVVWCASPSHSPAHLSQDAEKSLDDFGEKWAFALPEMITSVI